MKSSNQTPQCYVDLTRDAGFKTVLGWQSNKELLIGILNYILPPNRKIQDIIEYLDKEQVASIISSKISYFDLSCKGEDGSIFIIEMQNHREKHFFKRCMFYGAETYSKELDRGDKYADLRPVYVIAFLNYNYTHEDESLWNTENFIANYILKENRTNEIAPSTISVTFVELKRFTKTREACQTERDWLFYLFRSINLFDDLRKELDMKTFPLIEKMEDACKLAGMSKEQRTKYDNIMRSERDILCRIDSEVEERVAKRLEDAVDEAVNKAVGEAIAEGITKGREEGIAKGREEGMEEGKLEAIEAMAKKLFKRGMAIGEISDLTGLSEERLRALNQCKQKRS